MSDKLQETELDNIYRSIVYATPPPGMMFGINLNNDFVYQALKAEIQQLVAGVIGEEIKHRGYCDLKSSYINQEDVTCSCNADDINKLKRRQRQRAKDKGLLQ